MDWIQFAILVLAFLGVFIWNRTEARNDIRHMDAQLQANRELIREVQKESMAVITGVHISILAEMKDFHGRLCAIEERNRYG